MAFLLVFSDRTHGSGSKLCQEWFNLTFGSISSPNEWSSTEKGFLGVSAPSLSVFKGHWDNSFNKVLSLLGSPEVVTLVNKTIVLGPF